MPRVSLNSDRAIRERQQILYDRYGGFMTTVDVMKELGVSRMTAMKTVVRRERRKTMSQVDRPRSFKGRTKSPMHPQRMPAVSIRNMDRRDFRSRMEKIISEMAASDREIQRDHKGSVFGRS